jgi:predicted transcriptional regulator
MKTAISVSDELFERAERFAKAARVSRSRLYADALAAYLNAKEGEDVTNALNEVYSEEGSSVDPALLSMAIASLANDEWK